MTISTTTSTTRALVACALGSALAGCQVPAGSAPPASGSPASSEPVGETAQAASGSCLCNVTLPPRTTYLPGKTTIDIAPSLTTSGYVIVQDPVAGGFLAALVDAAQCKVQTAYAVSNANLLYFMFYSTYRGRSTVPNTPQPPNPVGDRWLARYVMAIEMNSSDLSTISAADASSCPLP